MVGGTTSLIPDWKVGHMSIFVSQREKHWATHALFIHPLMNIYRKTEVQWKLYIFTLSGEQG